MPRLSKEFVKMETRLINDYRFFTLSEFEQLVYMKFLCISRLTQNQIPKNRSVIRELLRTNRSETEVESAVNRLKEVFPKFKENKYFYHFVGYEHRLYNGDIKLPRNGKPDEDIDEDIDIEGKKADTKEVLSYFRSTFTTAFNKPYAVSWAKDSVIFKALLKDFKKEEVKTVIDTFFKSQDEFIKRSGYTVGVFKSQFNKLNSIKPKEKKWYPPPGGIR